MCADRHDPRFHGRGRGRGGQRRFRICEPGNTADRVNGCGERHGKRRGWHSGGGRSGENPLRFAVASQNFRTVTPHAGRTRRFLVFEALPGGEPVEVDRLDLPRHLAMHDFHGNGPHPLNSVDVVIAGSMGHGFAGRMARRGIVARTSERTAPRDAVMDYLANEGGIREAEGPPAWPGS